MHTVHKSIFAFDLSSLLDHSSLTSGNAIPRLEETMDWSVEYVTASIALALLVILLFKMKWRDDLRPPVAATVVGHIINFKRTHDFHFDLHRRYKTYRVAYPTFSYVFTTDPANVEHILRFKFANYTKGKFNHEIMEDLLGDGILSVDGEQWRQQRKLASFEFSTKVLKDFSSVVFREIVVKLSKILLEAYGTKQTVEMQCLLLKSTMDAICKLGFGVEINSLANTNSGAEASFAKAFDTASSMLLWRYADLAWKLKRYFNIGAEVTMKESIKTVDDFVCKVIQKRRQEISVQNNYAKPDILSRFIALSEKHPESYSDKYLRDIILNFMVAGREATAVTLEKHPESYSDKYLRDIILNFMVAGREATAVTLCWFFHLLCKNPDVEEKLLQEIRDLVKEKECVSIEESISMFSQSLTHTVLDKMHYLHASLSETLRLHPAVPMDTKYVVSDDILPDGFKIKKGDMMTYVPYSMGRMTYLWGIDAEEFRPERWLQNGIFQPQSPFKFTAFQAGPRVCLGKDFAYIQMKIFAAVLVRFFKFEAVEGKEVKYRTSLTLHMTEDGLNLRPRPRSNC